MKKFLAAAVVFLFSFHFFCEELSELNVSWQTVLSGKVVSAPAVTSYGFCVVTDARKIDSVSNEGKLLWEKEIENGRNSRIFSLPADFIAVLSGNGKRIKLLNPTGKQLWEKELSFEAECIYAGRDGRFFVYNHNNISCFGMNGIKKWQQEVPAFDCANIFEDEEGFLCASCGENKIIRISPFGTWETVNKDEVNVSSPDNKSEDYIVFREDSEGTFFCTKEKAEYKTVQNISLFSATFPSLSGKDGWNYIFLTSDYHLVFCMENWTLNSYKVTDGKKQVRLRRNYDSLLNLNNYYSSLAIDEAVISGERFSAVKNGGYGDSERLWASQALNILNNYNYQVSSKEFGTGIEYSLYEMNATDFAKVVSQISIFGTDNFINLAASFIKTCQNKTMLKLFLQEVAKYGYDPYGDILNSIDYISKTINPKNEDIILVICDAIYSLCSFMGRPAYNSKGRQIMAEFVSTTSTERVRNYARKTFGRIKQLEL